MALSPYRNKSSVYRSRSTSFSSPNSRSFLYQEVLTSGENALIRSFSCDQFLARGKFGGTVESTQVQITNFISPIKKMTADNGQRMTRKSKSKNKLSKLAIEYGNLEETPRKKFSITNIVYVNIFLVTIFCSFYLLNYQYCNMEWKTEKISNKLKQTVFGQDKAMFELDFLLKIFSSSKENMIISFIGSVGVGKTLVANIIQDNFPWRKNKHLHFFDSNTEKALSNKIYSTCGVNLIIIDGLNVTNFAKVLDVVEKTCFINSKLLFILIIQSPGENEFKVIYDNLKFSGIKVYNLVFDDLKHNDVKNCFKVELKRQGKYLPDRYLNQIVNEHMKYCNISKSYMGCKNVFNEVSLFDGNI